jgi:hypothetical protein
MLRFPGLLLLVVTLVTMIQPFASKQPIRLTPVVTTQVRLIHQQAITKPTQQPGLNPEQNPLITALAKTRH